ncbi:MAG: glycosyltransferase family 4 protein [Candidatus Aminicenantaceae bacterium]
MKVLFVSDVPLENPTSGAEQVLFQQAQGLVREGMEVYAITRQDRAYPIVFRNVAGAEEACYSAQPKNIVRFSSSLLKKPPILYKRFTEGGTFDAWICHQPFTSFSLLMRGKLKDTPFLYVFHSPSHEEYILSHENKSRLINFLHVSARRMIERYCLKRALIILVLSEYMKQRVQEIHKILPDKIIVNPGGVDLDRFKPHSSRDSLKKKLGFPERKIHLLTVRNLDPRMGIDNLLKCIFLLKKKKFPIYLILGGEGTERKNLERIIEENGLNENVTMKGFIPPGILPDYYGAADFFVLPTRRLEGFGLVTPESMACGTPVLGTPVGGTVEILSGLDKQFLFKDCSPEAMAEGIQAVINKYFTNRNKYDQLRIRCREYTEKKYPWQRHINQLKLSLEKATRSKKF